MRELTDELIAFLGQGVSLLVAGRDVELRPAISRAVGVIPGDDRRSFTALIADRPGATLLALLAPGAPFTLTASHVPTLRTVQMKGVVTRVRPGLESERVVIESVTGGFTSDLADVGYPLPVVRRMVTWPATAVEVRLEGLFEQSPGPGAGRPMGQP